VVDGTKVLTSPDASFCPKHTSIFKFPACENLLKPFSWILSVDNRAFKQLVILVQVNVWNDG
jgi:hypothetical protein